MLSRRRFLAVGIGSVGLAAAATACGTSSPRGTSSTRGAGPTAKTGDFSARFAGAKVAAEPNGDLAKVVWPDYVTAADGDTRSLYEFQVTHGELMRYMPCFCGCGRDTGHRSNRDCYIKEVRSDGDRKSVV